MLMAGSLLIGETAWNLEWDAVLVYGVLLLIPIIPQRTVHVLGGHGQGSAWAMTDGKSTGDIG